MWFFTALLGIIINIVIMVFNENNCSDLFGLGICQGACNPSFFLFGGENDNHNVDMMNPDLEFSTNKLCGFECSILRRNRKFHPQVQCWSERITRRLSLLNLSHCLMEHACFFCRSASTKTVFFFPDDVASPEICVPYVGCQRKCG